MKIQITNLKLTNFKGLKSFESNFTQENEITGANETGKSTLFDGFLWILTGKNSSDDKGFTIKPQNPDGTAMSKIETEGMMALDVNGLQYHLRRVYREKWTKRRGTLSEEMTGHETLYFINDVPCSEKEYQDQINGIITIDRMKLLSNPYYFNSIPWKDRRAILTQITGGELSDDVVLIDAPQLQGIYDMMLKERKTIEQLKKEYSAKKKTLVDELEKIPVRIDEANRNRPEYIEEKTFLTEKGNIEAKIKKLDTAIADKSQAMEQQAEKYRSDLKIAIQKEDELESIKSVVKKELSEQDNQKHTALSALRQQFNAQMEAKQQIEADIKRTEDSIKLSEQQVANLRAQWVEENKKVFTLDANACVCPTCNRELDNSVEIAEQLRATFNTKKSEVLTEINLKGKALTETIDKYKKQVDADKRRVEELQKVIGSLNKQMGELTPQDEKPLDINAITQSRPEFIRIASEIKQIRASLVMPQQVNTADLQAQREELLKELDIFKGYIASNERYLSVDNRIKDLQQQMKDYAVQISDLERVEFDVDNFVNTKISIVESRVNDMFDGGVSFRMFTKLINGGIEPTCECLVNGVPFKDVNHAGQINSGLHIINTLSNAFGITFPVWIDNAEAVNEVVRTLGQQIRMYVTTDKKLTVSNY